MTGYEPTTWKDHGTHITGRGKWGTVVLTGADAKRMRKELEAAANFTKETEQ